jgi:hypothetical protein
MQFCSPYHTTISKSILKATQKNLGTPYLSLSPTELLNSYRIAQILYNTPGAHKRPTSLGVSLLPWIHIIHIKGFSWSEAKEAGWKATTHIEEAAEREEQRNRREQMYIYHRLRCLIFWTWEGNLLTVLCYSELFGNRSQSPNMANRTRRDIL